VKTSMNLVFAFILLIVSGVVVAETEYRVPDSLKDGEYGKYLPQENYNILGISINLSTLESIQEKIGEASIYKGHHTASHVCYINNKQKIEFSISSLGFGYGVTERYENSTECSHSNRNIENGIGLKIGMKKAKVVALLGKPSDIRENGISYIYWIQEVPAQETQDKLRSAHDMPSNYELWLDVYSHISINFKNNLVVQFGVHTTETY